MNKIIAVLVLILIAVGVLMYKLPQSSWQTYSNPDLGISFDYPPEWGEVDAEVPNSQIVFSTGDTYQYVVFTKHDVAKENLSQKCPQPKIIQNNAYCRLFENGSDYMYEFVALTDGLLQQVAIVKNILIAQKIQGVHDLQSILDRTADPAVLQKIDTFEKVMLTLEVK